MAIQTDFQKWQKTAVPSAFNPQSIVGAAWRPSGTPSPGQGQAMQNYFNQQAQQNIDRSRQENDWRRMADEMKGLLGAAGVTQPAGYGSRDLAGIQQYYRDAQRALAENQTRQQQLAQQRQQEMEYAARWPSYTELMRQYENNPLQQLYTGRRYGQQPPISSEEYDYLRLSERYGGLAGPQRMMEERRSEPYMPGTGQSRDTYAYYQWLQTELQRKEQERKTQQDSIRRQGEQILQNFPNPGGQRFVHFLSPEMRRAMGVSESDVERSRSAYQQYRAQAGAWDQRREDIRAQNERAAQFSSEQQQRNLQSQAARGFYQTPFAYQNL